MDARRIFDIQNRLQAQTAYLTGTTLPLRWPGIGRGRELNPWRFESVRRSSQFSHSAALLFSVAIHGLNPN